MKPTEELGGWREWVPYALTDDEMKGRSDSDDDASVDVNENESEKGLWEVELVEHGVLKRKKDGSGEDGIGGLLLLTKPRLLRPNGDGGNGGGSLVWLQPPESHGASG